MCRGLFGSRSSLARSRETCTSIERSKLSKLSPLRESISWSRERTRPADRGPERARQPRGEGRGGGRAQPAPPGGGAGPLALVFAGVRGEELPERGVVVEGERLGRGQGAAFCPGGRGGRPRRSGRAAS